MSQLDEAKKKYDEIPIPEELSERVQKALRLSREKRAEEGKAMGISRRHSIRLRLKKGAAAAAAAAALFVAVVNTDTALAEGMRELPVIGSIARVLTFRSYETEEDSMKVSVEIPSVEMIAGDNREFSDAVNEEIYDLCQEYANQAVERAREYRQAFLDTGGTEEEWETHQIRIQVWYEIKSQTEEYLSLAVLGSESWSSAYSETKYYNISLTDGRMVTLKDILGEDYADVADESIRSQIKEKEEACAVRFWTPEEGGFSGITDDQRFYMNRAGNPVIVFEKYEIAPGAAGEVEFEIVR